MPMESILSAIIAGAVTLIGVLIANSRLYMGGAALKPYDVWLADYTGKTPAVNFNYNAHQHTSKGSVPGITGNVDLNVTTLNYPCIIEKKGLTRLREDA